MQEMKNILIVFFETQSRLKEKKFLFHMSFSLNVMKRIIIASNNTQLYINIQIFPENLCTTLYLK